MFNHEALKVYFRGEIVDFKDAVVSISNTSFMYGLGAFTGIRAHFDSEAKKLFLFRPDEHYKRFRNSCNLCNYKGFLENYTYEKFEEILTSLLKINNFQQDAYIRVTNFTDENSVTPKFIGYGDSLCAFLYPLGDYVPTTGMKCCVSSWNRIEDNTIPARGKLVGAYLNTAFAKTEALSRGYDEAIVVDARGHVVEGSAENLFIVRDGVLITPPVSDSILEGITRKSVMQIAEDLDIKVVERSIDRSELYFADEIILTGTGAKVSPVIEVDERPVGDGIVGPLCKQIQDIYFSAIVGKIDRYKHWLIEV